MHIRCKVHNINFEGRSDGDSIMKVVNAMKPRRAIIVRGREDACKALAELVKREAAGGNGQVAFIPRIGETVDATTESHIYQVRLPEAHLAKLHFSRAREGLVAWVDGQISRVQEEAKDIHMDGEEGGEKGKGEEQQDPKKAAIPALLPLPDDQVENHKNVSFSDICSYTDRFIIVMSADLCERVEVVRLQAGSYSSRHPERVQRRRALLRRTVQGGAEETRERTRNHRGDRMSRVLFRQGATVRAVCHNLI